MPVAACGENIRGAAVVAQNHLRIAVITAVGHHRPACQGLIDIGFPAADGLPR